MMVRFWWSLFIAVSYLCVFVVAITKKKLATARHTGAFSIENGLQKQEKEQLRNEILVWFIWYNVFRDIYSHNYVVKKMVDDTTMFVTAKRRWVDAEREIEKHIDINFKHFMHLCVKKIISQDRPKLTKISNFLLEDEYLDVFSLSMQFPKRPACIKTMKFYRTLF